MTEERVSQRTPWPFAAGFLIATAALLFSSHDPARVSTLQLIFLLSYLFSPRLPNNKILAYTLRAIIWTLIIGFAPRPHITVASVMYEPTYVNLFGIMCASEFVLRAWIYAPKGPNRTEAFLLTALIFTAATNTYDALHINILVPIYAISLIFMFRSMGVREKQPLQTRPRAKLLARFVALRAIATMLALLTAATIVVTIRTFENQITYWAVHFTRKEPTRATEIGLNSSTRLGELFNPQPSLDRILLIDGPPAERHLRAMAFSIYEQGRWGTSLRDQSIEAFDLSNLPAPPESRELTITRLTDSLALLPVPLNTARVRIDNEVRRDGFGILNTNQGQAGSQYHAIVPISERFQGPLCLAPDPDQRRELLRVPPEIDPRVEQLAQRIAGNADPLTRVLKLQLYLRSTHAYSLVYQPQGEPLSDFILNNRAAHCQYFASAMVMLARAAGVPARFVAGYYAHERYTDREMVVRDRDAHAWAECFIDGIGWITLDATPSAGRPDQLFHDPSAWRRLWERLTDFPATVRSTLSNLSRRTIFTIVFSIAILSLSIAGLRALYLRWKLPRATTARAYGPIPQPLLQAAHRFEQILKTSKIPCPPNRTWRNHLDHLSGADIPVCLGFASASNVFSSPSKSESFAQEHPLNQLLLLEFLNTYDALRFGAPDPSAIDTLHNILLQLEQHSHRGAPCTQQT